jgi:hypothetical protein
MPKFKLPEIGDQFFDVCEDKWYTIIEVGDRIEDEFSREGRSVVLEDEVWHDCFWSEDHQRFQYILDV